MSWKASDTFKLKPGRFRNGNRSKPSPPNMPYDFENTYGARDATIPPA
ncbi:hypothetical protein FPSE_07183 [Fusarium pseudograminearum CS3096]|uniref:Uncharacterized protein n=1 Tax=Fusarium pseudograminearum (strain CS3096) TaxID=1028729 RepID=K3UKH7_FUSPC|nr:hypothetical protein FPSE_07183 [Fusarium pseudograminearum CS3096]EKJ72546.1 hypothetical protein FPSE_07183 [Fusarium pseudograminearum CS3096]